MRALIVGSSAFALLLLAGGFYAYRYVDHHVRLSYMRDELAAHREKLRDQQEKRKLVEVLAGSGSLLRPIVSSPKERELQEQIAELEKRLAELQEASWFP